MENTNKDALDELIGRNRSSDKMDVRSELWERLETKLERHEGRQNIIFYRRVSYASAIVAVIALAIGFSFYINKGSDRLFASNGSGSPLQLEELVIDEPVTSDIYYINMLNDAYAKLGMSEPEIEFESTIKLIQ